MKKKKEVMTQKHESAEMRRCDSAGNSLEKCPSGQESKK
jgi:hypothetical protein